MTWLEWYSSFGLHYKVHLLIFKMLKLPVEKLESYNVSNNGVLNVKPDSLIFRIVLKTPTKLYMLGYSRWSVVRSAYDGMK
jgi:hypothetical protein